VQLLRSRWPSSAAHIHDDGPATLLSGVLQAAQRAEGFERSAMRLSRSARYGLMKHTKPKKRPRRWNSTLPVTESKPRKRSPVKKKNPARIKKRREEAFGDAIDGKASWIRELPCIVAVYGTETEGAGDFVRWVPECDGNIEAAHAIGRGAGGLTEQLLPMCRKHHREQHDTGPLTFEGKYHLSLTMAADLYEALYQNSDFGTQ
jgi:hypothetical protein